METVIYISQLAPSTLTRPRGEETGRKAAVWARSRAVELDLEHTSPSLSFLDGLVLALQDARASSCYLCDERFNGPRPPCSYRDDAERVYSHTCRCAISAYIFRDNSAP
jgi:hypothetical protein